MRKCCCCISVHVGAAILGFIGLTICALEFCVLIPYLFQVKEFNPIEDNMNNITFIFSRLAKEQGFKDNEIKEAQDLVKPFIWPTLVGATVEAGIYGLCCLLMMIGAACHNRCLMLPYLILQMLMIIIMILTGVGFTILFFMLQKTVIYGIVAGGVTLVIAILLIYFWAAVQRAYVELGNNDYMYSPAPIKPVGHYDGRGGHHADHYPTSPQHFPMDERH